MKNKHQHNVGQQSMDSLERRVRFLEKYCDEFEKFQVFVKDYAKEHEKVEDSLREQVKTLEESIEKSVKDDGLRKERKLGFSAGCSLGLFIIHISFAIGGAQTTAILVTGVLLCVALPFLCYLILIKEVDRCRKDKENTE